MQSQLTDEGARVLATIQSLEEVIIAGNISPQAAEMFASLERLSRLAITSSQFTDEDQEQLPRKFAAVPYTRILAK